MLAAQLKTGTKRSHTAAENTKFVGSFLRGVVSEENYRTLIKDFYFVYSALEEEMERLKDDEFLNPIYFTELNRLEGLKKDLRYYYGPNWNEVIKPSEGCVQYVERIHEVADKVPYLLVGHHYTRYLGDLSGGQILKGIAQKSLKLGDEAFNFYDFKDIESATTFKQFYRRNIDTLPVTQKQFDAIITEANYAFRLNMYMFDELSGDVAKSTLQIILGLLGDFFSEMIVSKRFR